MNAEIPPLDPREAVLEQELRSLAPHGPSAGLKDRIRQAARELETAAGPPPLPRETHQNVIQVPFWRKPGVIGVAAALVIGLFAANVFFSSEDTRPTQANILGDPEDELIIWGNPPKIDPSPFALKNQVLVSQENDGIVEVEPGQPMWKIRIKVIDRNDPRKEGVPIERVLYVPVRHD